MISSQVLRQCADAWCHPRGQVRAAWLRMLEQAAAELGVSDWTDGEVQEALLAPSVALLNDADQ